MSICVAINSLGHTGRHVWSQICFSCEMCEKWRFGGWVLVYTKQGNNNVDMEEEMNELVSQCAQNNPEVKFVYVRIESAIPQSKVDEKFAALFVLHWNGIKQYKEWIQLTKRLAQQWYKGDVSLLLSILVQSISMQKNQKWLIMNTNVCIFKQMMFFDDKNVDL